MHSKIKKIIINGNPAKPCEVRKIISSISDKNILIEKGGYLFTVLISGDCCNLGILPYQIDGTRKYHFELDMPADELILTGFINTNNSITLLFKLTPEKYKRGLSPKEKSAFKEAFYRFFCFLLEYGFPGNFEIDTVTQDLLTSSGILKTAPHTAEELVSLSC